MDYLLEIKVKNIVSEIENQLKKETIDESVAKTLLAVAINRISMLLTHIGYLESKLEGK